MLKNLRNRRSLSRFNLQAESDQGSRVWVLHEVEVIASFCAPTEDQVVRSAPEWTQASDKLVENAPKTPNVGWQARFLVSHALWCHVLACSHKVNVSQTFWVVVNLHLAQFWHGQII